MNANHNKMVDETSESKKKLNENDLKVDQNR